MSRIFRIIVLVLVVATVILAIAIAYVRGVMEGVRSQQWRIKELIEELHPGIIVDPGLVTHPLYPPLMSTFLLLGACWIVIAIKALTKKWIVQI